MLMLDNTIVCPSISTYHLPPKCLMIFKNIINPRRLKICTQKTTQHKTKKLRKTHTNGSTYRVHGLEELTSSKCPYYPKQFIDSMQSLLQYQ